MIRTLIITLALTFGISCFAAPASNDPGFIRKLGGYPISNLTTNRVLIVAAKGNDEKLFVTFTWNGSQSITKPLHDGWFIYPARTMQSMWLFDGDSLSLVNHATDHVTVEANREIGKTCPKAVRDALPEKIRKKYFP